MDLRLDRRSLIAGATGVAAAAAMPGWAMAAGAKSALTPERGLASYRRILCGAPGEEVLWWFIGDLYVQAPGKSVVPIARSLTIGGYTAVKSTPRSFSYRFREAGVIVDLNGQPIERDVFTGAAVKVPLVEEKPHNIDWVVQDDGNIVKTNHGKTSTLNLRWTETSDNLLLLETEPGVDAFALTPGDTGYDWKGLQSTRTVYTKRASLARPGFVPAEMIYHVALKMTPTWASDGSPGDKYWIIRGIGQKSRAKEVVNRDALTLVRRFFPKFL